jgi:hypothetical protein
MSKPKLIIGPNGTRAARMSQPRTVDVLQQMAVEYGVCIRPVPYRYLNPATGTTEVVDLRCGATQTAKCPPCAAKAKRLRQVQCRQGWHRTDEPITVEAPCHTQQELVTRRAELEFAHARALQLGDWDQAEACQTSHVEFCQATSS